MEVKNCKEDPSLEIRLMQPEDAPGVVELYLKEQPKYWP